MSNSDNPKKGAVFQEQVLKWFQKHYKRPFEFDKKIPIGDPAKNHKFDIVDTEGTIAIECKRHTWTKTGNIPSAKMGFVNEAAFYLRLLPEKYEKYIVMLKSHHPKRKESLAEYYYRTNKHLLGKIIVAEYDPENDQLRVVGSKRHERMNNKGHIYFIRHGETVWNVENKICGATDIPLTEAGHQQAIETGHRILKEGIRTAIVGRPNVGKSSLLNHLAGEERAIVTEIEGTTRDTLSETVRVGGVLLHLTDTAGIRQTQDKVEQIGVHRAQKALDSADLILFVIDSSRELSAEDAEIADRIIKKMEEGTKCILLVNKVDLLSEVQEKEVRSLFSFSDRCPPLLFCSLQTGEGMEELGKYVSELFHTGEIAENNEVFLSNLRHKDAVREARNSICLVKKSIEDGMSEDFFSIDLMNAYRVLGTILGEAVEDDLVEEIFSKFCMGK